MKKKFKIILLIATILLFILFLFASCRKTNAYTYNVDRPFYTQEYDFNAISESGFSIIMDVKKSSYTSFNILTIMGASNTTYYFIDNVNGVFRLADNNNVLYTYDATNLNTSLFYIQFCFDYVEDDAFIYFSPIDFVNTISQGQSTITDVILLNQNAYWSLNRYDFLLDYTSAQPETKLLINNYSYQQLPMNGLLQFYLFDIDAQFSEDIYEQTELLFADIKTDIPLSYYNFLMTQTYDAGYDDGEQEGYDVGYDAGYDVGYDAGESAGEISGYQSGYDDGYDAGESSGYTSGYNAGYSAGETDGYRDGYDVGYQDGITAGYPSAYQNGYDAGYEDARVYWQPIYYQLGYEAGEVVGFEDGKVVGYNNGYNQGYADGQDGVTAVTPVFNVISGVFDVVASVLSIYLFPGITIGTFILVPLFFSIIGLVIWVWKKG